MRKYGSYYICNLFRHILPDGTVRNGGGRDDGKTTVFTDEQASDEKKNDANTLYACFDEHRDDDDASAFRDG